MAQTTKVKARNDDKISIHLQYNYYHHLVLS